MNKAVCCEKTTEIKVTFKSFAILIGHINCKTFKQYFEEDMMGLYYLSLYVLENNISVH